MTKLFNPQKRFTPGNTVELVASFGYASGVVATISPESKLIDFILLLFGTLLPTNIGGRIGSYAGLIFGPITANHLYTLTDWDTLLPMFLIRAIIQFSLYGKLTLGILGSIVGAVAFNYFARRSHLPRFVLDSLAGTITGASIGALSGALLIILGLANPQPAPGLIGQLLVFSIQHTFVGAVLATAFTIPLALLGLAKRHLRDRLGFT